MGQEQTRQQQQQQRRGEGIHGESADADADADAMGGEKGNLSAYTRALIMNNNASHGRGHGHGHGGKAHVKHMAESVSLVSVLQHIEKRTDRQPPLASAPVVEDPSFERFFLGLRLSSEFALAVRGRHKLLQPVLSNLPPPIVEYLLAICAANSVSTFFYQVDTTASGLRSLLSMPFHSLHMQQALHVAVKDHPSDAVRILLAFGGSELVNSTDDSGCSPLHYATLREKGDQEVINLLIREGADPNKTTFAATPAKAMGVGKTFVGVGRATLDACNKGSSPLMWAALASSPEAVSALLKAGAKVNHCDAKGETALHKAAEYEETDNVAVLLSAGADVHACDHEGVTALHQAASEGDEEMISLLVKMGADLEAKDSSDTGGTGVGATPLFHAASGNNADTVLALLNAGARIDATNNQGQTALHIAAKMASYAAAEALVKKSFEMDGIPIFVRDKEGVSCMTVLIQRLPNIAATVLSQFENKRGHWDGCSHFVYNFALLNKPPDAKIGKSAMTPLESMVEFESKDLMAHPTMTVLLDHKWEAFAQRHYRWEVFMYFLLLISFTLYVMLWHALGTVNLGESSSNRISMVAILANQTLHVHVPHWANLAGMISNQTFDLPTMLVYYGQFAAVEVVEGAVLLLVLYHLQREFIEFITQGSSQISLRFGISFPVPRYFLDLWNIMDLIAYSLALVAMPFMRERLCVLFGPYSMSVFCYEPELLACASLALWIRLLQVIGVVQSLGPFVRMIFMMMSDILIFFCIFSVFWFGFATAFLCVFKNAPSNDGFETFTSSLLTLFNMMLGDADYSHIKENASDAGVALYILYMLTVSVLLLNLLIAAMSDSYQAIKDDADKEWRMERASCIHRIERSLPLTQRLAFYNDIKTVEVALPASLDGGDDNSTSTSTSMNAEELAEKLAAILAEKANEKEK